MANNTFIVSGGLTIEKISHLDILDFVNIEMVYVCLTCQYVKSRYYIAYLITFEMFIVHQIMSPI